MKLPFLKSLPSFLIWPALPGIVKYLLYLRFRCFTLEFSTGLQQGDPLSPLLLTAAIHPIGQYIVGRGPGPAWLENWALLRWRQFTSRSKTPFGPKPVWGPGNSQCTWLPTDILVSLCDAILDYLSHDIPVCVAGREGQQRLFVVRDAVYHWTLGSWPPPLVFWHIMPTTLFRTKLEGWIW